MSNIIDDLGGATAVAQMVARKTGEAVSRTAVCNWRRRGVPWRYRAVIEELAAEAGRRDDAA